MIHLLTSSLAVNKTFKEIKLRLDMIVYNCPTNYMNKEICQDKYPKLSMRVSQETKDWLIRNKKKHITWENFLNVLKENYKK